MLYQVVVAVLALATGAIVGSLCALLAELREVSRRKWFAVGAACGIASVVASGWLQIALMVLPPLGIAAVPASDHDDSLWRRSRRSAWWLRVACIGMAGLFVYAPLAGGVESLRLTATAPAQILESRGVILQGGNDKTAPIYGSEIHYQFEVNGIKYSDWARKKWRTTDGAKVCFDPSDPGRSHRLEKAGYSCGSFDPFGQ